MDFETYQQFARETSQWAKKPDRAVLIALLGLAGESGSLLTEYKKWLRDGEGHRAFRDRMAEELGDLLWYVAEIASCLDLDLEEIAAMNVQKVQDRWVDADERHPLSFTSDYYDELFPRDQQLPRCFRVRIEELAGSSPRKIVVSRRGKPCGNALTDNSFDDDGYRFHDAFHFANAAALRWSPVARKLLGCKRRSQPRVDEVQDGGRAIVIEEGVVAYVFDYARRHDFFERVDRVDTEVLRTIKSMVSGLEVASRSTRDWENAILSGFRVWRQMRTYRGGFLACDLDARTIRFERLRLKRGQKA
jgi:NTP pyrophosphatase (non-canonical NTP hydrolase)